MPSDSNCSLPSNDGGKTRNTYIVDTYFCWGQHIKLRYLSSSENDSFLRFMGCLSQVNDHYHSCHTHVINAINSNTMISINRPDRRNLTDSLIGTTV